MIYSDLDGTFLDGATYSYETSLPVLRAALEAGAQVVFCSSKTAAEIDDLLRSLDLSLSFIAENGGAIFIPEGLFPDEAIHGLPVDRGFRVIAIGAPYDGILRAIRGIREELGVTVRGFSDMTVEEAAARTGLSLREVALALRRQFDEPFVLEDEAVVAEVEVALAARGFQVTRGGRFFHALGRHDKGMAVHRLNGLFRMKLGEIVTAGLGDSANDIPLLTAVDWPVLIAKLDGSYDADVLAAVPEVIRSPQPVAWARAVREILSLPDVC